MSEHHSTTFEFDITCPPLCIRYAGYVPPTEQQLRQYQSEFFEMLQHEYDVSQRHQYTSPERAASPQPLHVGVAHDRLDVESVMPCGMRVGDYAHWHLRRTENQRNQRLRMSKD